MPVAPSRGLATPVRAVSLRNADFSRLKEGGAPADWAYMTHRSAIAPRLSIVTRAGKRWARMHLQRHGASLGVLGQRVRHVHPGQWIRFRCAVRGSRGIDLRLCSVCRLTWYDGKGTKIAREYLDDVDLRGSVSRHDYVCCVPRAARNMDVELIGRWGDGGWVEFGDLALAPTAPPPPRTARLAVVQLTPASPTTPQRNRELFAAKVAQAGEAGADLVVLSEGITVVGTGKPMAAVAEPAEGPTLAAIGAQARAHRCYVVVGIYERDGDLLYNTGLLIGRDGRLAGKYRKVHLPEGEMDQGFTPGLEHPVFETDLGRVGLQICYDHAFVESARLLALHGAEVIACPIWGDPRAHGHAWEATARARALDNGVYFVGAIYGPPRGLIVDPHGDIIADAKGREGVYLADADLTAGVYRVEYHAGSYVWRYFKHVFRKERMPDTYADIVGW